MFGTDSLKDDASKLTRIYLKVKGGTLSNEEYRQINFYCQLMDISIINFFKQVEGNKRLSITALLCSGLSKIYSLTDNFTVSTFDIDQIFGRLMCIDKVDWVVEDVISLKISMSSSSNVNIIKTSISVQEELLGIIHSLSMTLGIRLTDILLYLMRTGVIGYNEFIERFSNKSAEINSEYMSYAKKYEKVLLFSLQLRYDDMLNRIKQLYNVYDDMLEKEHKNLKEEMKRVIDLYESSAKG